MVLPILLDGRDDPEHAGLGDIRLVTEQNAGQIDVPLGRGEV